MFHPLLALSGCWLLLLLLLPDSPVRAESICSAVASTTTIKLVGFTRPKTIVDITPEVSGRCEELYADIGEPIPADTVFARLDNTFVSLELQKNTIARTQNDKTLAFDKKQVERYRQLVTTKASAKTRLDELELKYEQTQLRAQQLETEEKRLRETLIRHTIHAPAGWLIIGRQVEAGEWVTAGQPVARVGDYQHLIIPIAVRPVELQFLQKNVHFPLHIIDEDIQGMGRIKRIAPNFDPTTRKIHLDLELAQDTLERLTNKRGGLRVEIPILIDDPMQAFLLPAGAIEERYEETWLTRESGEPLRVIILGPELSSSQSTANGRLRVVSSEIKDGDRFQCRRLDRVKEKAVQ